MTEEQGSTEEQNSEFPVGRWALDFDRPGYRDQPRIEFLRAIERTAPGVMQSLSDELSPMFHKRIKEEKINLLLVHDPELPGGIYNRYANLLLSMKLGIYCWGNQWHLVDRPWTAEWSRRWRRPSDPLAQGPLFDPSYFIEWLVPVVIDTLGMWAANGAGPPLQWRFDGIGDHGILRAEPPPFAPVIAGWSPRREAKAAYLQRVGRELEALLHNHVDEIEATVTQPQLRTVPAQLASRFPGLLDLTGQVNARATPALERLPDRFTPRHFDWLVLYQVLGGRNCSEIARVFECTPYAVMKGVPQAAEMAIGPHFSEWLLPSRRRRRKKSADGSRGADQPSRNNM